jgi:hypothetical protein
MKAIKIKSKIDGMFTWAIIDEDGIQHEAHKHYDGALFVDGLSISDKEIRKLINTAKSSANRKAKEQAYKDCGLVKVKGALGGTYWE